ncbi:MAG TPA: phosphoglucomutase [Clostridiales bacterium]|nr:phosphoglucomutase [Clostridiales bacterium]
MNRSHTMKLFDKNALPPKQEALCFANENLAEWNARIPLTDAEKADIERLKTKEEYFIQRFLTLLPFGTAGLRGEMVPGCSAMNRATVALTTLAMAETVLEAGGGDKGIIVGFDSRLHSAEFARLAAEILAVKGIRVYLFDELRPTPELSFSIRRLGCQAGINITASHNPKKDNGYKVYWNDGAQLPPEQAKQVAAKAMSMDFWAGLEIAAKFDAAAQKNLHILDRSADEYYFDTLLSLRIIPDLPAGAKDISILYSPLHGAGYRIVPEILRRAGFTRVTSVPSQATPDGTFPTAAKPNPQFPEVFEPGITLAKETNASLIIATDPDADRSGLALQNADGSFVTLNGDQIGILLLDYIIKGRLLSQSMPEKPFVIISIVTSPLVDRICEQYTIPLYHVYTGFKYIGEKIREKEDFGGETCIFAYEESHGYLPGSYCRDKDGVAASLLIAEMAAFHSTQGMTCADAIDAIYAQYGYIGDFQDAIIIHAADPMIKAAIIMEKLHQNPPVEFDGVKVAHINDYLSSTRTCLTTGHVSPITLSSDNVISFELTDGCRITARPSGTEPLIKFYYSIPAKNQKAALVRRHAFKAALESMME